MATGSGASAASTLPVVEEEDADQDEADGPDPGERTAGAVREAKLRIFVSPGQVLSLTASLVHEGSGFAVTKAAVEADGKTVANCEITFRVMAFPDPKFRASMLETAARLEFPVKPNE